MRIIVAGIHPRNKMATRKNNHTPPVELAAPMQLGEGNKTITLSLLENHRGVFCRVTETSPNFQGSIMIPEEMMEGLAEALAKYDGMIDARYAGQTNTSEELAAPAEPEVVRDEVAEHTAETELQEAERLHAEALDQ